MTNWQKCPWKNWLSLLQKQGKTEVLTLLLLLMKYKKLPEKVTEYEDELASSITFILASISRTISALKENLKQVDKAILAETKGFINPLISIKGIGPVYSTGILACIGDIKRFASHNQLARYAGLVWKRRQTGKTESEEKHMVIECDKYLRYYLIEAANSILGAQ